MAPPVAAAGAIVLATTLLVSGCGGNAQPGALPTNASVHEFCAAATALDRAGDDWGKAQKAARAWQRVGVPGQAPADIRRGVDLGLRLILRAKKEKQIARLVRHLRPAQQDDLNAVDGYISRTCR